MSETKAQKALEKQTKSRPFHIIITAIFGAVLLCALVVGGFGACRLARNSTPATMPANMAGVWARQGNIFAFCSNSQFPQALQISKKGKYSGTGGILWLGGEFQVLIGERVRVETSQGDKYYDYDLLVLEDSSFLTFSTGLLNNCRVSYFRSLELYGE